MYKRVPTQIVVAAFNKEEDAEKCLHGVAKAMMQDDKFPICTNAAVAKKGTDGKTKVKEYGKPNMLKGLVGGTAVGGAAGAAVGGAALSILGPIGVGAGALAGGAIGAPLGAVQGAIVGAVGKWSVEGMDKNKLEGLREALEPGTSALVLVFAEVILKKSVFETELKEYKNQTDVIAQAMSKSISNNLKEGNDCAHLLAVTEDGIVGMKVVVGKEVFDIATVVLTEDAVAAAEMKVTPGNVETQKIVATEDAIFAQGAVVGEDAAVEYEFTAIKE